MAMLGRLALGTLFVVGLLAAYLLNSPVPEGFSEPWNLRVTLVSRRFVTRMMNPVLRTVYGDAWPGIWRSLTDVQTQPPPGVKTQDFEFDGVPVRLFVPEVGPNSTAAIIFMHGGGWVLNSVDKYNEMCGRLSLNTGMAVLSIGYRLAPEHPYPAAFQDCEVATRYFLKNAHKFGVDPSRVAVMGDSAGGNLAAALALRLRDDKIIPALKMQVLLYPALQAIDLRLPSYIDDKCPILYRDTMVSFWLWYALGEDKVTHQLKANDHTPAHIKRKYADIIDRTLLPKDMLDGHSDASMHDGDHDLWGKLGQVFQDPYFSPGVAADLRNLPRAFVFTAGHDPLRDDGVIYAKRLEKAGNQVKHVHHASGMHGLFGLLPFKDCKSIREETTRYIVANL